MGQLAVDIDGRTPISLKRTSDQALLIFTRNPEFGKCKTRLAARIGDQRALDIYRFLLRHTASVAAPLSHCDKLVFFSERPGDGSVWDPAVFGFQVQHGEDLGARMQNAFSSAFQAGYSRVVLIGSDLYDLETPDLEGAFDRLKSCDAVIGPATDGGYYLLGLTRLLPEVFQDKAWGTASVFEATLKDLAGIPTCFLPPRNDVDYYEDIAGNPVFEPFLNDLSPYDPETDR